MFSYGSIQSLSRPSPEIMLYALSPMDENIVTSVVALVDTGATITCIPEAVLKNLGVNLDFGIRTVKYVSGEIQERTCIVHIRLHKCLFRDIEVVVANRRFALIG